MRVALAVLTASVSALAFAQEPETVEGETFVPITPIERMNPNYPARAMQHGNEGWVMLSFVVSETGEVKEPMIEDSSGVDSQLYSSAGPRASALKCHATSSLLKLSLLI